MYSVQSSGKLKRFAVYILWYRFRKQWRITIVTNDNRYDFGATILRLHDNGDVMLVAFAPLCCFFYLRHAKHCQEVYNSLVFFQIACIIPTILSTHTSTYNVAKQNEWAKNSSLDKSCTNCLEWRGIIANSKLVVYVPRTMMCAYTFRKCRWLRRRI